MGTTTWSPNPLDSDLPEQFEADGMVLDTFGIERGHLQVTKNAERVENTHRSEVSVLPGVINGLFGRRNIGNTLLGRTANWRGNIYIADRRLWNYLSVEINELVIKDEHAGMVMACSCEGDQFAVVVSPFARGECVGPQCFKWLPLAVSMVWRAQDLAQCSAWYRDVLDRLVISRM